MHFLTAVLYTAITLSSLAREPQFDGWNKKSTLYAESAIELPGMVLEPGIYIVKLQQGTDKRSTVQIWNSDETQVLATLLAIPDHRAQPEDFQPFTFHNVPGKGPRPIQSWYYPGDQTGLEFVYPKVRAREIAKASEDRVMASKVRDGVIVAVTPNGKEVVMDAPERPSPTQTARQKPDTR